MRRVIGERLLEACCADSDCRRSRFVIEERCDAEEMARQIQQSDVMIAV